VRLLNALYFAREGAMLF